MIRDASFASNVAGPYDCLGLEQQYVCLLVGNGQMLDTVGDDDKLTLVDVDAPVSQFHPQPSLHYEEQFVLGFVMMPDELAFEFDELYVTVIHLAHDFRAPVLIKRTEFLSQAGLFDHSMLWATFFPSRERERPVLNPGHLILFERRRTGCNILRIAVQTRDHEVHYNPIEHHHLEPDDGKHRRPHSLGTDFKTHMDQHEEDNEGV